MICRHSELHALFEGSIRLKEYKMNQTFVKSVTEQLPKLGLLQDEPMEKTHDLPHRRPGRLLCRA